MMADFRALCAELTAWAEKTSAHYFQPPDEPAVPEGKKPTRDELWELWLRLNNELPDRPAAVAEFWEHAQIDARARAAELLQRQAPQPPADGEVAELVAWLRSTGEGQPCLSDEGYARLTRAAELLQRQDADESTMPLPLADTHYEWELEDAQGSWQAGGSSNSQSDVEREGMRYLQTYAQHGPHKLIIRQHTTQTINEITNG